MDYKTIWLISDYPPDYNLVYLPFIVGGLIFLIQVVKIIVDRVSGSKFFLFKLLPSSINWLLSNNRFVITGLLISIIGLINFIYINNENEIIRQQLKSQKLAVTEGIVHVNFKEPKEGHTTGDLINVGNENFEISYFNFTRYYHLSISHEGFLTENKMVRISFIRTDDNINNAFGVGKILKIEEYIGD